MTVRTSDTRGRSRSQRLERDAWGVVFCGGASVRMGRDKALLRLGSSTLLERATGVLASLTPRVLLATGTEPRYPELGLECLLDDEPGAGPLSGLSVALARLVHAGIDYACVLACDMPHASERVFRALLAHARANRLEVCLVSTPGGSEPFCGVYHVRALRAVRAALARGERRMNAFHGEVRVAHLSEAELDPGCARNLNTPEEYRSAGGEAR